MKLANALADHFGFHKNNYVTKSQISKRTKDIPKQLLMEILEKYDASTKHTVRKGIKNASDALTLLRRVLRHHERAVCYKRYNDNGKTSYKYKLL